MHFIIDRFVDGIINLFKFCRFATTLRAKWAIFAVAFTAAVDFFGVAFRICFGGFVRKKSVATAFFYTFVPILFFVEHKAFPSWFVLTKVWDVSVNALFFAIL